MKTPILGSGYVARSTNAADNRMVNMFPEFLQEGGKEPAFLTRAPGLRLVMSVGIGPIRGMWQYGGKCYVVSGYTLYSLDTNYTVTTIGTIAGTGNVSMADNGVQLFIAHPDASYIYDNNTATLSQITDPDFPGASCVGYLDEMFIFSEPNSRNLWVTATGDGLDVDGLDFATGTGFAENIVAMAVDHREIWVFGANSIKIWYNAASTGFPLEPIEGAFNETGCAAKFSVAKMDNTLFWLGSDARGKGIVYRANGYSGVRISTHAMEWQIQQYSDISDAVAYTYQQNGHSFYVLSFPSADTTWVYDAATQLWHERADFVNGAFARHRGNCQSSYNAEILIGDYQTGTVYAYDLDAFDSKWLRSWRALPTGANTLKRTTHHSLQLDCESGVGLESGQGADPVVMLRWSDDGGHTWSNEHWAKVGKIGEYHKRVIWRRLGMTTKLRDRIYEVSGTDPVRMYIMGAELSVSNTNA